MRTQKALETGWDSRLVLLGMCCWEFEIGPTQIPRRGTDLERGYGDVRPWRPPFHASSAARKGPISSKIVRSQDPLLRKFGNFSLTASIFTQILAHKPPSLEILAHKPPNLEIFHSQAPPFSEANVSSQAPHFGSPGHTPLPEKKKGWVIPRTNINFQRKNYTNWPKFWPNITWYIFFSKFS